MLQGPTTSGEEIRVKPKDLVEVFGESDYSADYWGHYNTVLIDSTPLQLLKEKMFLLKNK